MEEQERDLSVFDTDTFLAILEEDDELDSENGFECMDAGEWVSEHKYAYHTAVFKHMVTGRFIAVCQSRSGSYYSDYEYGDTDIYEVFPRTVTQTIYTAEKPE